MNRYIPIAIVALATACNPLQVTGTKGSYPDAKVAAPIGSPSPPIVLGNDITLTCTMASPGSTKADCVGGGFPYTVPPGKTLCLTTMYLQNKFESDPLAYGASQRAVYLQENGITVTSHWPAIYFNPPLPVFSGMRLTATISNAQTETQNIYAFEQGFLVDAGKNCFRKE